MAVNQQTFTEVVEAGRGWTKVRTANGEIITLRGDRNWRNNNPGNIEYGNFARSMGAIGTDGRFAVFPSYQMGRDAKEGLLFDSPSYRDRSISSAISRYAPQFENDTNSYINQVAASIGVSPNTRLSSLTPSQRSTMMDAMQRVEGFRIGTINGQQAQPPQSNQALNAIQSATNPPAFNNPSNRMAFAAPQPQTRSQMVAPIPAPPIQRAPISQRNQDAANDITTIPPRVMGPPMPQAMQSQMGPIPVNSGNAPVRPTPVLGATPPQFSNAPPPNIAGYGNARMPTPAGLPPLTPMEQDFGRVFGPTNGGNTQQPPQLTIAAPPQNAGGEPPMGAFIPPNIPQPATALIPAQPTPDPRQSAPIPPRAPQQRPNIFNTPQTGGLAGRLGFIPMRQGEQATGRVDDAYFERLRQNLPNPQELARRVGNALTNPQPRNDGPRKFNPQTGKWELQ